MRQLRDAGPATYRCDGRLVMYTLTEQGRALLQVGQQALAVLSDPGLVQGGDGSEVDVAGHVAPGGQVERGGRVGGDDLDDRAGLGVGDAGAQLQQEGTQSRPVPSNVMSAEAWGLLIGCSSAAHRLLAVAAMTGRTARARIPPVRARTG